MRTMDQVIVDIDADGNVKVEAQGVRGQGCAALTKAIEDAVGRTTADQKKAEYYQPAVQPAGANANAGNRNQR